jgi:hypothetical protein
MSARAIVGTCMVLMIDVVPRYKMLFFRIEERVEFSSTTIERYASASCSTMYEEKLSSIHRPKFRDVVLTPNTSPPISNV